MHPILLLSLAGAPAMAGDWTLQLEADLPTTDSAAIVYQLRTDAPPVDMDDLLTSFGMAPVPELDQPVDGHQHAMDEGRHAHVFASGAAAFHDLDVLDSVIPIEPLSPDLLWARAEGLLAELGLLHLGPLRLQPGVMGAKMLERPTLPGGRRLRPLLTHQMTIFDLTVDGLPTFGGGSQVELIWGEGGQLGAFSHALRELDELDLLPVIGAAEAARRYDQRAHETGRLNLYKAAIEDVERVVIEQVTFGYYLPDLAQDDQLCVPVFQIEGSVHGTDPFGEPGRADLLWLEPAVDTYGIDALAIAPLF